MHALQMIALGFVDYDSPDLSNETRKKLRSDLRKTLAAYDIDFLLHREKVVQGKGTNKRVFWKVAAYEIKWTSPKGEPLFSWNRSLVDTCKRACEVIKEKAGEDLDTLAG